MDCGVWCVVLGCVGVPCACVWCVFCGVCCAVLVCVGVFCVSVWCVFCGVWCVVFVCVGAFCVSVCCVLFWAVVSMIRNSQIVSHSLKFTIVINFTTIAFHRVVC